MKFVCIRPIKLRKGEFKILYHHHKFDDEEMIEILPNTYSVFIRDKDIVTLEGVRYGLGHTKLFVNVHRSLLINDGYFKGNLFEIFFIKPVIKRLNERPSVMDYNKRDQETVSNTLEMQEILKENSMEFIKILPVWIKCNIILKDLEEHFYNEDDELDEKQLEEINKILRYPCDKNEYDYNIFFDVKNIKDIKQLASDANLAALDVQPQYQATCKCCGKPYYLFSSEIQWYLDKGLEVPKRCEYCRKGIKRPELYYPGPDFSDESSEEEPVKTEMQIALEKAGMHVTEEN